MFEQHVIFSHSNTTTFGVGIKYALDDCASVRAKVGLVLLALKKKNNRGEKRPGTLEISFRIYFKLWSTSMMFQVNNSSQIGVGFQQVLMEGFTLSTNTPPTSPLSSLRW